MSSSCWAVLRVHHPLCKARHGKLGLACLSDGGREPPSTRLLVGLAFWNPRHPLN